ncbi:MAG: hypothetical protein Rhims3KO_36240 [Hyphomicrobiales bacterium]
MAVDKEQIRDYELAAKALGDQNFLEAAFTGSLNEPLDDHLIQEIQRVVEERTRDHDPGKDHRDAETKKSHDYTVKDGHDGFSLAGLRLHGSAAGQSVHGPGKKKGRAAESAYREALMDALRDGTVNAFIASEIFGDMSDSEIRDLVTDIEAKTGQSFEQYAQGKLGKEAAQRRPGESDAEYNRRILDALTILMLDPKTGQIKPEYDGDPLAEFIKGHDDYQHTVEAVADIDAEVAKHGKTAETDQQVEDTASKNYSAAKTTSDHISDGGYKATSQDIQDQQADQELHSAAKISSNAGFFSGTIGPSAAEIASAECRKEFNVVACPPEAEAPSPDTDATPDAPPTGPALG